MSHIVESWPLTKLNGGLSRLHSADEDAVSSLLSCLLLNLKSLHTENHIYKELIYNFFPNKTGKVNLPITFFTIWLEFCLWTVLRRTAGTELKLPLNKANNTDFTITNITMTTVVLLVLTAFTLLANYSLGWYSRNFSWKTLWIAEADFYWLDLPRQQWSLLNRFRTEQGHCGACRRKWRLTDTDLCPYGETLTMSHIVESCPLTKLNGGLSRLHSADEDAVSWLTNYG